jgi:hypothetical protein
MRMTELSGPQKLFSLVVLALITITFSLAASAQQQNFTVLHSFTGTGDGGFPMSGVIFDSTGNLYGATEFGGDTEVCERLGCGVLYKLSPATGGGWHKTSLFVFTSSSTGGFPEGNLFFDSKGNLWGNDEAGGNTGNCSGLGIEGCGLIFELSASSEGLHESIPLIFNDGDAGGSPFGGLIADNAGNFYGTANTGGSHFMGVVYKLSPISGGGWQETVLYNFPGATGGGSPFGPLVRDASGNLYGTASNGGDVNACPNQTGCGVVFELSPTSGGEWKESVLHTFTGQIDGANSYAGLIFDAAGNLYGTTYAGGNTNNCGGAGCGVVFELSPTASGWKESALHVFTGGADGSGSEAGLAIDAAGNLYGTTASGGDTNACTGFPGCGVVFKLTPSGSAWSETVLHFFTGSPDGSGPLSGVTLDGAGNLYGTTRQGGIPNDCLNAGSGCGVVFKIAP